MSSELRAIIFIEYRALAKVFLRTRYSKLEASYV